MVTLDGQSFGALDVSPTVMLGSTRCAVVWAEHRQFWSVPQLTAKVEVGIVKASARYRKGLGIVKASARYRKGLGIVKASAS